jgi:hypothetical protein
MPYFVSRQNYYYSGERVVEVEAGGLDCAGADMLVPKYPGEGEEYADPREAVKVAVAIRAAWAADLPEEEIFIGVGSSLGMGLELEGGTDEEALAWAEKVYENLPKCDQCGEMLGDNPYMCFSGGDERFCSEYCAELYVEEEQKYLAGIDAEEDASRGWD